MQIFSGYIKMAYSLVKKNIILKGGKTVSEFYYFNSKKADGTYTEPTDPMNEEAIKGQAGLIFDMRLLQQAQLKYGSKILPDRINVVTGLYDKMAIQVLDFMNRIIWEVPPTNNAGAYRDNVGVLTGEPLSRAFQLGMQLGADLKKYDEYVLELHFPTAILQKGLQWEKRNYLEDINKTKDLSSFEKSSKKNKK